MRKRDIHGLVSEQRQVAVMLEHGTEGRPYLNRLLRMMPEQDLALLQPHLRPSALPHHLVLSLPGVPIEVVHFLEQGISSMVARTMHGVEAEIGFIGSEGMTGSSLIMGDDRAPHRCYMPVGGASLRMAASEFTAALATSPTLRPYLLRFVNALNVQTAFTALANVRYTIEERLCRCLLMCQDRSPDANLRVTHERLGMMVGSRRSGITVALQSLVNNVAIASRRGEIEIIDRSVLLALANGSYGTPEAEYRRLFAPFARGIDET